MEQSGFNYCGKFIYDEQGAKKKVKHSNGVLKGSYYCDQCDGWHVTKQTQHPARQQWFKDHPKKFRNKHT